MCDWCELKLPCEENEVRNTESFLLDDSTLVFHSFPLFSETEGLFFSLRLGLNTLVKYYFNLNKLRCIWI